MTKLNDLDPRFWSYVDQSGGPDACWPWMRSVDRQGYGRQVVDGHGWGAHRIAWTLTRGPIPDGLVTCHHCDNPPCCNPAHLFVGTQRENLADMKRKGRSTASRTHCKHGHEFTPENTYLWRAPADSRSASLYRATTIRMCKTCMRIRDRARRRCA